MLLPTTVALCSITFIRGVTGASYNLESVAAVVSLQEFVPDTLTMVLSATVTQQDDNGHRRRLCTT